MTHQNMTYYMRITIKNETRVVKIPFSAKFVYDESNTPVGCLVNDEAAVGFVRNLQGDIIATVTHEGDVLAEYSYDPWGKVTVTCDGEEFEGMEAALMALYCPFAYRGYNYDYTTGLYYLQSRYYNPEWGRFLNVDDTNILLATQGENLGANLFAYCKNNPMNRVDYTGYDAEFIGPLLMTLICLDVVCRKGLLYSENITDVLFAIQDNTYVNLTLVYFDNGKKIYQECYFQVRPIFDWRLMVGSNEFSPVGKIIDSALFWSDWFTPGVTNYTGLMVIDFVISVAAPAGSMIKHLTSTHYTKFERYILDEVEKSKNNGEKDALILFGIYQYQITKFGIDWRTHEKILLPY